jgi:hypothetical protein
VGVGGKGRHEAETYYKAAGYSHDVGIRSQDKKKGQYCPFF